MSMTNRTIPFTDRQILCLFVDVPANITSLRGWEETVYLHHFLIVPLRLIGKHGNEAAPACIDDGLCNVMVSLHTFYIQVLNADGIVSPYKGYGALMQIVGTAVANLLVDSGNFELLVFKPSAAFLFTGKMLLRLGKFALVSLCISVILKSLSFGSDEQVFYSHIHTNGLSSLLYGSSVFLLREYGNKILFARCLGDSHQQIS